MQRGIILAQAVLVLLLASGRADVWTVAEPKGHACNAAYPASGPVAYAEIFPPRCRNNPTDSAFCYYYVVESLDCASRVNASLHWKGKLANPVMPHRVLVPRSGGTLVTLDEHGRMGYDNCVVIYDEQGSVLERYSLSDLYPEAVTRQIRTSASSRWWLVDPRFAFSSDDRYFYLMAVGPTAGSDQERAGQVHRFDLDTGELDVLLGPEPDAGTGYRADGREYSLNFSSLTDIREYSIEK
jgi:hypothetical protein